MGAGSYGAKYVVRYLSDTSLKLSEQVDTGLVITMWVSFSFIKRTFGERVLFALPDALRKIKKNEQTRPVKKI